MNKPRAEIRRLVENLKKDKDFGFIKDASKYYLITLVFHDQSIDISSNIEKIKDKPVFHAEPIIRREYPFQNESIEVH